MNRKIHVVDVQHRPVTALNAIGRFMNDFTKYELCSLLWAIGYVRERTNNSGDIMIALRKKIQDMIDNYCEHDPKFKGLIDTKDGFKDICLKCQVEIK